MLRPDERLFFIHIPKTAGTSLIAWLDGHFDVEEICPAQLWAQMARLPLDSIPRYRLFRGHFGADGLKQLLPRQPVTITMLREPVSLALSTYRFILREPGIPVHALVKAEGLTFEQFIRDRRTRRKVSNLQTSNLSFAVHWDPATEPLGGGKTTRRAMRTWLHARRERLKPRERLRRARRNLRRCRAFGLVERFEDSLLLIAYSMGWPAPDEVQRLMVAPKATAPGAASSGSGDARGLSDEVVEQVKRLNPLDMALYHTGQRMFEKRWNAMLKHLERYAQPGDEALDDRERTRRRIDRHFEHCQRRRKVAPVDRARIDFDGPLLGSGWHRRETNPSDGSTFRWTGPGRCSTIDLPLRSTDDWRLTMRLLPIAAPAAVDGLRLMVGDTPVPLVRLAGARDSGIVLQGTIPRGAIPSGSTIARITLEVDHLTTLDDAGGEGRARSVGVPVSWIDIRPCAELAGGTLPTESITPEQKARRRAARRASRLRALTRGLGRVPMVGGRLREMYQRLRAR